MSVFSSIDVSAVPSGSGAENTVSENGLRPRQGNAKRWQIRKPAVICPAFIAANDGEIGAPVGGILKRAADLLIASVGIFLLAPLLVLIALLVRATTGGPAIYRHRRVGFQGRYFDCLKFRSMVVDGDQVLDRHLRANPAAAKEWQEARKLARDPRVTRFGYFLRKTSLDELPQLFNILLGDMSCVGPRPVVSEELQRYEEKVYDYCRARPGITGLWQVSGRSCTSYEQRILLDSAYVRNWSFGRDVVILLQTLPAVMKVQQAA